MDLKNSFAAAAPTVAGNHVTDNPASIVSPAAPPAMDFNVREQEVFEYLCDSLRQAGLEHITAGMPIAVIVRTYVDWLDARQECIDKGRVQYAKSGYATPFPWADDEKRLKMELGQWLPKACLTIPSLARVRKDTGPQGQQDDLFAGLVNHAINSPAKNSMN